MRKEPDYYTVMERTIKYYQRKYDPEGYFSEIKEAEVVIQDSPPVKIKRKKDLLTFFFI